MASRWFVLGSILVLCVGLAYFAWPRAAQTALDPSLLARFESEHKPIVQKLIAAESMLERIQLVGQLQKSIADLTETQRREIWDYARKNSPELRDAFISKEQRRVDRFFQLSPEEQAVALDKHIDEMEQMNQLFAGLRSNAPGGPPQGPPPGGAPNDKRSNSEQRRQLRVQQIINSTSPKFRAQMSEYMQRVDQRRDERGLPRVGIGPPAP